jgi:hypothetical protein
MEWHQTITSPITGKKNEVFANMIEDAVGF